MPVKITVELPDLLVVAAKQKAAAERRPLRALVEQGLRMAVEGSAPAPRPARRVGWVVAKGGVPPETGNREAMHEWMRYHG